MFPLRSTLRQLLAAVMVLVIALQACVLPAVAQDSPAGSAPVEPASAASPAANYSLSGRVLTPANVPVAGVTVTATSIVVKYPIVFLPGVMGTMLANNPRTDGECAGVTHPSGTIWLKKDSGQWWIDLDALILAISGNQPENDCDQVVPVGPMNIDAFVESKKVNEIKPYARFIQAAEEAGFPVLPYGGYDWRLPLTDSAAKLDKFIVDNVGEDGKVFLVAHSMGGLLARAYVADAARANKIAGVVTVGTPYLGAPVMAQRVVSGRPGLPIDLLFSIDQIKEIARKSPGIQQLLPSAALFSADSLLSPYYLPATGQVLDSYDKTMAYFVQQGYLSSNIKGIAEEFHASLDGFDRNFYAAGKYTALYSADTSTPALIRERFCRFGTGLCLDVQG